MHHSLVHLPGLQRNAPQQRRRGVRAPQRRAQALLRGRDQGRGQCLAEQAPKLGVLLFPPLSLLLLLPLLVMLLLLRLEAEQLLL